MEQENNIELQNKVGNLRTEEDNLVDKLKKEFTSGVAWFYWIAGLSIVNTILSFMDISRRFVAGLGVTVLVDIYSYMMNSNWITIAIAINVLIACVYVLIGIFSKKGYIAVYILGMILYALDAFICVRFIKDVIAVGFHIFVLYLLFKGLKASWDLKKLNK